MKVEVKTTATWDVTWGENCGCVRVRSPCDDLHTVRDISKCYFPDSVTEAVRALQEEHRPLADDEFFDSHMVRRNMRIKETVLSCGSHGGTGCWFDHDHKSLLHMSREFNKPDSWPRALAFWERHKPDLDRPRKWYDRGSIHSTEAYRLGYGVCVQASSYGCILTPEKASEFAAHVIKCADAADKC